MFKNIKNMAFTLAEVLIALSIIGVVAAMTIPSLMNDYREHVWATTLKKNFATMTTVCERMLVEENASKVTELKLYSALINSNGSQAIELLKKHVKMKNENFWYRTLTPNNSIRYNDSNNSIIYVSYDPGVGIMIGIDVNGDDAPNKAGEDRYAYVLRDNCDNRYSGANEYTTQFERVKMLNWRI